MQNIVLFGPPNSGKGTLAERLEAELGIVSLSTGNLLRRLEREGDPCIMKLQEKYSNQGKNVPDKNIICLVEKELQRDLYQNGVIFDGFPRTVKQAEELDKTEILYDVLFVDAPEDILRGRAEMRRSCTPCNKSYHLVNIPPKVEGHCDNCNGELIQRPDDLEFEKRIATYRKDTSPLVEYYAGRAGLIDASIDAKTTFKAALDYLTR